MMEMAGQREATLVVDMTEMSDGLGDVEMMATLEIRGGREVILTADQLEKLCSVLEPMAGLARVLNDMEGPDGS